MCRAGCLQQIYPYYSTALFLSLADNSQFSDYQFKYVCQSEIICEKASETSRTLEPNQWKKLNEQDKLSAQGRFLSKIVKRSGPIKGDQGGKKSEK